LFKVNDLIGVSCGYAQVISVCDQPKSNPVVNYRLVMDSECRLLAITYVHQCYYSECWKVDLVFLQELRDDFSSRMGNMEKLCWVNC
jgi:hypothetical protein